MHNKDILKIGDVTNIWEDIATDRPEWRMLIRAILSKIDKDKIDNYVFKDRQRHGY